MLDETTNLLILLKDPSLVATKGYLAGEWVEGDGSKTFEVVNPARGDVITNVADISRDQAAQAISAAETAQKDWAAITGKERSVILRNWFSLMIENADDLATILTVEQGKAHSHAKWGWETFTDKVIDVVNEHCQNVVFLLWGSHAQKKGKHINREKHHVLHAPHPSPLSAHRGFLGCKHFSQTNEYLIAKGKEPINWQV